MPAADEAPPAAPAPTLPTGRVWGWDAATADAFLAGLGVAAALPPGTDGAGLLTSLDALELGEADRRKVCVVK